MLRLTFAASIAGPAGDFAAEGNRADGSSDVRGVELLLDGRGSASDEDSLSWSPPELPLPWTVMESAHVTAGGSESATVSATGGGLSNREIIRIVNRYIGVDHGYLGDFSYRTHADFYPEYCDLDINPFTHEGTTRERFISILSSLHGNDQAKVIRGVIEKYPAGDFPAGQCPRCGRHVATESIGIADGEAQTFGQTFAHLRGPQPTQAGRAGQNHAALAPVGLESNVS